MTGGDHGGPPRLLVSVTEIRRLSGSQMDLRRELEAHGIGLTDSAVPDGAIVELAGELESIAGGVVLTGDVTVPWSGSCRRCLDDVTGTATVPVREVFEVEPTDGETWPLVDDQIDVGPLLHDTALLALPLAPLCRDDCPGPAPDRFPTSVEGDDGEEDDDEAERPRDPRWAGLDDLEL